MASWKITFPLTASQTKAIARLEKEKEEAEKHHARVVTDITIHGTPMAVIMHKFQNFPVVLSARTRMDFVCHSFRFKLACGVALVVWFQVHTVGTSRHRRISRPASANRSPHQPCF